MRQQVLQSYKRLLRVANETFGPDKQALTDVKNKIREEFGRQRAVPNENVPQLLEEAEAAEKLIRSIVQAQLNERGNYEIRLPKDLPGDTIVLEPVEKKT